MLEELLESVKQLGNEKLAEDFEKEVANVKKTTERVHVLENELNTTIAKKNKLRDLIKKNTGLEEISEEGFTNYLNELKQKDADEALRLDNEKLSAHLNEYKTQLDTIKGEYEGKLKSISVEKEILASGLFPTIESNVAKKLLLQELKQGAMVTDSGLGFTDENGSLVLKDDGTPLTLKDKMESMAQNPDFKMFFPEKRVKGGGKQGDSSGTHGVKDLSKLTRTEKAKLMSELSPEDYQALVRANLNKQ